MIENGVYGFVQNLQKFLFDLSNQVQVDGLEKYFDDGQIGFSDLYMYMHYSAVYGFSHYFISLFVVFLCELIWFRVEQYYRQMFNHLKQVVKQFIEHVSIH